MTAKQTLTSLFTSISPFPPVLLCLSPFISCLPTTTDILKNPISFFGNGHYCYSQFEDFEGGPALHLHHSSILLWYVSPSHQLYSTFIATSGILQQCVSPMFATRCPIHLAFFRQMPLSFGTGSLVCLVNGAL